LVATHPSRPAFAGVVHADRRAVALHPGQLARHGGDALARKDHRQGSGDVGILAREQATVAGQDGHLAAQAAKRLRHLRAHRGTARHEQVLRQRTQTKDRLIG
jgi:hypothetical protein